MVVSLANKPLRTYALAWMMMVLGLSLTTAAAWALFSKVRALDQDRFQRQVAQTVEALRDRHDKYQLALAGLADFASSRSRLTRAEWNFRVRLLQPEKNYPGLLELGLLEAGTGHQLQTGPAEGDPLLHPSSSETNAFRLQHAWVCPPSAFDGLSPRWLDDPIAKQAAQAALFSGTPSYIYRRELSTELVGKPARGFTIFIPFMEPRLDPTPTHQLSPGSPQPSRSREVRSQGVVFGSIEPNLLLGSLFGTAPRELGFDLFSGQPLSVETCLNASGSAPATLSHGFNPYLRVTVPLQIHGQEWTLALYTTPLFEKESSRYRPWTVLFSGTMLSGLVTALLFVQIRARVRHEAIAAELRSACGDLQRAQNERDRIGRDIHDGAIQSLYGLQLTLGHYDRLRASNPESAGQVLDRCRSAIDLLIAELRTFLVQQLPEGDAAAASIDPAITLENLVQRFRSASHIPIHLAIASSLHTHMSLAEQAHLRQIAQEALSNSLRHTQPSQIRVELTKHNDRLRLCVSDDGQGFNSDEAHPAGQGLANMKARALQLGGALTIQTGPDQGTKVILDFPPGSASPASHE